MAKARYQHQHGTNTALIDNVSGILPDEVVIVDSGDNSTKSGSALHYKPLGASKTVKVANAEDVNKVVFGYEDKPSGYETLSTDLYSKGDFYFNSSDSKMWICYERIATVNNTFKYKWELITKDTDISGKVDKTTPIAGIQIQDGISAAALKEALGSSEITFIDESTSAEWSENSIPTTYTGQTGEAPELAYREDYGSMWYLYEVLNGAYYWERILTVTDLSGLVQLINAKMSLAPLNPTAEQIVAMPSGQLYDEASEKAVTIKGGTELLGILTNVANPEYGSTKGRVGQVSYYDGKFYQCFGRNEQDTAYVWKLISFAGADVIKAQSTSTGASGGLIISSSTTLQEIWELFTRYHCVKVALTGRYGKNTGEVCWITNVSGANHEKLSAFILPLPLSSTPVYQRVHFLEQIGESSSDTLRLVTKYVYPPYEEYYTKTEINAMIGDIETALSEV